MLGPTFIDDMNTSLFDMDDLLDFPMEDVAGDIVGGGEFDDFQSFWSPAPPQTNDALIGSNPGFHNNNDETKNIMSSEIPTSLPVPYEGLPQLDWLSNFMEESFPAAGSMNLVAATPTTILEDNKNVNITGNHQNNDNDVHQFQSSSPVSVLENSSPYSGGKVNQLNAETFIRGRARSKRSRPATFNPRPLVQLISPKSSVTDSASSELVSETENNADSGLMKKKKKIKKKKLAPLLSSPYDNTTVPLNAAVRKCLHCEITKTPQWRAGPLGPKTLCNACGVRYKSGRLYPEYRPAASPTFVPALHSNSHKKVLEMRIRSCEKLHKLSESTPTI